MEAVTACPSSVRLWRRRSGGARRAAPPRRGRRPGPGRRVPRRRCGRGRRSAGPSPRARRHRAQDGVPAACPWASLSRLKWSRSSIIAATRVPSRRAWRHRRGACSTRNRRLYRPVSGSRWRQGPGRGEEPLDPPAEEEDPQRAGVEHPGADPDLDPECDGVVVARPQGDQADHQRDDHVDADLPAAQEPGGHERREQEHQRRGVAHRVVDAEDDDEVDQVTEQDQPERVPPAGPLRTTSGIARRRRAAIVAA